MPYLAQNLRFTQKMVLINNDTIVSRARLVMNAGEDQRNNSLFRFWLGHVIATMHRLSFHNTASVESKLNVHTKLEIFC